MCVCLCCMSVYICMCDISVRIYKNTHKVNATINPVSAHMYVCLFVCIYGYMYACTSYLLHRCHVSQVLCRLSAITGRDCSRMRLSLNRNYPSTLFHYISAPDGSFYLLPADSAGLKGGVKTGRSLFCFS